MSRSESRQRTKIITVRVDEEEYELITELAKAARCSQAEIARAILFDRDPQPAPVPCSERHPGCTTHHRNLVDGYRDQRHREELAVEAETGGYAGDLAHWRAMGGNLTTFAAWLRTNRAS